MEQRSDWSGSHAAALAELAAALAGAASPDELGDRALNAVRSSLGTDRASILLFDEQGVMRFRAWSGLSDAYRARTEGHSPWDPASQGAEPIVVPDVAASSELGELRDVVLAEGIRALAFVPIVYAGRLLGKYMLYFDEPRELSADELVLASAVADQIAVAVEQHRVADELRTSHEQLEVIFRGVGEGVTVQRPDGTLAYVNDAAATALGFSSAEELLATSPAAIIERFEILDERGEPFPPGEFPGRRVLQGEDQAEALFRYRRRDTGDEQWSIVKATAIRDGDGRVLYAVNLFRDVTDVRRREEWQRFLADSGEILNASLDYETTARELARLIVPVLADWCTVTVQDEQGLQQIALAHGDPERVQWALALRERYPPDPNGVTGVAEVVRSGRSELYEEISDEMLEHAAQDETHLGLLRRLGLSSAMIVPLSARDRTFGALTFVAAESRRRYTEDDLAQAEDVARLAALAIDNARLHSAAQDARREAELAASVSQRLHSVTASLARAATARDVGRVAVGEGAAALGADAAALFVYEDGNGRLKLLDQTGFLAGTEPAPSFPAGIETPVTETTHDGVTITQPVTSGGDVVGFLHVVFRTPRGLETWELTFVETLASQCGQALERARLYERDHEVAVALQQTLLPAALPPVEGVSLDAHYVPARYESNVGGDWYDAMVLADGTIAFSVGDVVGHGLLAATAMGQLRNAIRAYLLEDISPGQVLRRLNRYAGSIGEGAFSTTVVATLDPTRTTWRFASAGHPPPLLIADGHPRFLEMRGPPVGAMEDFDYQVVEQVVSRPAKVVLYTDGLIERRGARLEDGFTQLLDLVAAASPGLDVDAETIVETMLAGEGPADDVAVLVVDTVSPPLLLELPSEPRQLAVLRRELRPWLRSHGLDEQERHLVLVAVGEAAANAIEHPRDAEHPFFAVEARVVGDELVVRVSDTGRWRLPTLPTDRGRGISFMRELMSDVEIRETVSGTQVTLRRRIPATQATESVRV